MNIRQVIPEALYYEICSFIPDQVCHECGDLTGIACECWRGRLPRSYPGDDLHELDLWCDSCQFAESNTYCICYRVREMVERFENPQ